MKWDIEVDDTAFQRLAKKIEDNARELADKVRDEIDKEWRAEARTKLNTTYKTYTDNLKIENLNNDEIKATITGALPVALELGKDPFPLKPGFLKGAKSRVIPMNSKMDGKIFRTAKDAQQRTPWIHPGFKGLKINEIIQEKLIKEIIPKVFYKTFEYIKNKGK